MSGIHQKSAIIEINVRGPFFESLWREASFIQEVSGVYTSPFLDTDELKMALRARKVFAAFEKRASGP